MLRRSVLAVLLAASCYAPDGDIARNGGKADDFGSFEDFKAALYCEPDDGLCFIQGDMPVLNDEELLEIFRASGGGQALSVHREEGLDAVWNTLERFDLSYCVSSEFGERQGEVARTMRAAADEWESIASVRFRHATEEDGNCTKRNPRVIFDVAPAPVDAFYFARAFFPNYEERGDRRVLIHFGSIDEGLEDPSFEGKLNLQGILRHELGHVLGFRHEHIRPENSGNFFCFEDENFRTITEYDAKSTMHYPQCDGEGDWSLELTDKDAEGARFFYPELDRYAGGRCQVEVEDGIVSEDCAPVVREILELANTASFEVLDLWADLDIRAANEIVDFRNTQPYTELQELRDVSFLGEVTIRRMYEYLYVSGRCPVELDSEGRPDIRCRPVAHRILELANHASLVELDDVISLDSRAAENILVARAQQPFLSIAELWAVPFVKTRALGKMYAHLFPTPPVP